MRDHRRVRAFQLADEVALLTYKATPHFPKEELDGRTAQMRRAAVSIPSNMVEGCSRQGQADDLRFLEIAFGSLRESEYQGSLAQRLGYPHDLESDAEITETEKVLGSLMHALRNGM